MSLRVVPKAVFGRSSAFLMYSVHISDPDDDDDDDCGNDGDGDDYCERMC